MRGGIDASKGVNAAHQAIGQAAEAGRPGGASRSGNGQTSTAGHDGHEPPTTQDGQTSDRTSSRPEWLDNVEEGNAFNRRREPYYTEQGGANEVHVEPRTDKNQYRRVDSYVPGEEIVSRKHTQLGEIQESTAKRYLDEFAEYYGEGTIIADTPTNRRDLGDAQIGKPMKGDLILEVPAQNGPVPKAILEHAESLGITIRDENGRVYELDD